jgi:hypothetical protein
MAKTLNQVVTQDNQNTVPKRIIVQFTDDSTGSNQVIVEYDSMTTESKAIYDTFIQMCEVYMNA